MLLRSSAVLKGSKTPFPSEWKLSLALSALEQFCKKWVDLGLFSVLLKVQSPQTM